MSGSGGGGGSPNNTEWRFNQTLHNVRVSRSFLSLAGLFPSSILLLQNETQDNVI
jgi:hypothetical protein